MRFVKCPRCDLNYITESERYCKVCLREMKGDGGQEEVELCSICNEAPALPGRDMCLFCLKEMNGQNGVHSDSQDSDETVDPSALGSMEDVSAMDEIPEINSDIPADEFGEMQNALSLESMREEEADDEEDEEEND